MFREVKFFQSALIKSPFSDLSQGIRQYHLCQLFALVKSFYTDLFQRIRQHQNLHLSAFCKRPVRNLSACTVLRKTYGIGTFALIKRPFVQTSQRFRKRDPSQITAVCKSLPSHSYYLGKFCIFQCCTAEKCLLTNSSDLRHRNLFHLDIILQTFFAYYIVSGIHLIFFTDRFHRNPTD